MPHALEIPEICLHLSKFLSLTQLFACTLVCRKWKSSFSPMLYLDMSLVINSSAPTTQTLEMHSVYVKFLNIDGIRDLDYYSIPYINIIELSIRAISEYSPSPEIISQLIQRNEKSLTKYSVSIPRFQHNDLIWQALDRCNNISEIQLVSPKLNPAAISPFIKTCYKITHLFLRNVLIESAPLFVRSLDSSPEFLNLTHITYYISSYGRDNEKVVLEIINKSPNLMHLFWGHNRSVPAHLIHSSNIREYKDVMTSKIYKNLVSVSLKGIFGDKETSYILNTMTNATDLVLNSVCFHKISYLALMSKHANTLVHLDISLTYETKSEMVQGILSGCPSLEKFWAQDILGTDLVRIETPEDGSSEKIILGQDWVCLRLKSLRLFIGISDFDPYESQTISEELHRQRKLEQFHAFRQLSRLHKLENLDISRRWELSGYTPLELKLRSRGGELESLETLKNLRILGTKGNVDEESLAWMKKTWPKFLY